MSQSWHCFQQLVNNLQKVPGEEVVADVACSVGELAVQGAELGRVLADLALLHHLDPPLQLAHHAHRLAGAGLLHHLVAGLWHYNE